MFFFCLFYIYIYKFVCICNINSTLLYRHGCKKYNITKAWNIFGERNIIIIIIITTKEIKIIEEHILTI